MFNFLPVTSAIWRVTDEIWELSLKRSIIVSVINRTNGKQSWLSFFARFILSDHGEGISLLNEWLILRDVNIFIFSSTARLSLIDSSSIIDRCPRRWFVSLDSFAFVVIKARWKTTTTRERERESEGLRRRRISERKAAKILRDFFRSLDPLTRTLLFKSIVFESSFRFQWINYSRASRIFLSLSPPRRRRRRACAIIKNNNIDMSRKGKSCC